MLYYNYILQQKNLFISKSFKKPTLSSTYLLSWHYSFIIHKNLNLFDPNLVDGFLGYEAP